MDRPIYKDGSNMKKEDDFGHCRYVCKDGDLRSEQCRLLTFSKWPSWTGQCPKRLAEAGLFFTGFGDKTKCAFCMGILLHWNRQDEPIQEHERLHPTCPFIQGKYVGNIPLQSGSDDPWIGINGKCCHRLKDKRYNKRFQCDSGNVAYQKTCHVHGNVVPQALCRVPGDVPENTCRVPGNVPVNTCRVPGNVPENTCRVPGNVPENTCRVPGNFVPQTTCHLSGNFLQNASRVSGNVDYSREENRIRSFAKWPSDRTQTIEDLARAGFYHVPTENKPDRVMCAYCKGKLYNWKIGDDPWIEHAKCSPNCPYIELCVGSDLIRDLKLQN